MVGDERACKRAAHGKVIGAVVPYGAPSAYPGVALKYFTILTLCLLSACSWFHRKPPPPPDPPEFIVTGAPAGSIVFIDDVQRGPPAEINDKSQQINVTAGEHKVEVRFGDTVVYRENTYIKSGERIVVTVLSGSNRE
jgi:hypothetical protein